MTNPRKPVLWPVAPPPEFFEKPVFGFLRLPQRAGYGEPRSASLSGIERLQFETAT